MRSRFALLAPRRGIAAGVVLAAMALLAPVQHRIERRIGASASVPDLLYFSSPSVLKKLALGYDSLLADLYWMRAIQYYGRRDLAAKRPVRYKNLASLLDITSSLDPDLLDVYRFGASFLAEADPIGAGQPLEAVKLLDKGIARHPLEWRLRFDKGFVFFWSFRDFQRAGEVWLEASRLPSAPPWMPSLAAMALSRGGAIEIAKALWQRQYQDANRGDMKENALNHLVSVQADEDRWTLEFLVQRFKGRFGSLPSSLHDLVRAGMLKAVPQDPSGVSYQYDSRKGEVHLSRETKIRYLETPREYREVFWAKLSRMYEKPPVTKGP